MPAISGKADDIWWQVLNAGNPYGKIPVRITQELYSKISGRCLDEQVPLGKEIINDNRELRFVGYSFYLVSHVFSLSGIMDNYRNISIQFSQPFIFYDEAVNQVNYPAGPPGQVHVVGNDTDSTGLFLAHGKQKVHKLG